MPRQPAPVARPSEALMRSTPVPAASSVAAAPAAVPAPAAAAAPAAKGGVPLAPPQLGKQRSQNVLAMSEKGDAWVEVEGAPRNHRGSTFGAKKRVTQPSVDVPKSSSAPPPPPPPNWERRELSEGKARSPLLSPARPPPRPVDRLPA